MLHKFCIRTTHLLLAVDMSYAKSNIPTFGGESRNTSAEHTFKTKATVGGCDENLNDTVRQVLKCSWCRATLEAPIFSCSGGHLVCSGCQPRLKQCPICRVPGTPSTRCTALEKISEKVKLPCVNAPHGCTALLNRADMAQHWESCQELYPHACVMGYPVQCTWRGKCRDLVDHVNTEHPGHYVEEELVQFEVDIHETSSQTRPIVRLVSAFEELFWVYCVYRSDQLCKLGSRWITRDVEAGEVSPRFKCKVTYFSAGGLIQHDISLPSRSVKDNRNNWLKLPKTQLDEVLSKGKYSFTAKILKT